MRTLSEIYDIAAKLHGGAASVEVALSKSKPKPERSITKISSDRLLSAMTRRVFHAGFVWRVADEKWPAFEEAFHAFDTDWCARLSEKRVDALLKDARIVRNAAKIRSVRDNARFINDLDRREGGASAFIARWPSDDYVGLLDFLTKNGSRLSGQAAMRFLRAIGKPSFITTEDGVKALVREQIIDRKPSAKRDFLKIQAALNLWSD